MSNPLPFQIVSWSTDIITLIIVLIFLYNFYGRSHKTHGVYMVFILNISDCISPTLSIILKFLPQTQTLALVFGAFRTFFYYFTLTWTVIIAAYVFQILYSRKTLNSSRFLIISFLICCLFSSIFAAIVATQTFGVYSTFDDAGLIAINYSLTNLTDQILYTIFNTLIGTLLPIVITSYCYFKVYKMLARMEVADVNPARVLAYPIIQVLCYLPGIIANMVFIFQNENYDTPASLAVSILHSFWGFLNLLAYGFMNREEERKLSIAGSIITANNLSGRMSLSTVLHI